MTQIQKAMTTPKTARRKSPQKARILLVDDDERNLLAMSEVLDGLAEVVTATSGREALRHLLKGDFAVILLDVFMPGMDGYETAGLIREREQTARIPIIFLSAVNKETEHLMRGYSMGAVDYVFKPVDPLILKSKVSVFVDLYAMRVQVEEKSRAEQQLLDANFKAELERHQIERELQASQTRQAAILDALPMALYEATVDDEGRMTRRFVGGDVTRLTGLAPDALEQGHVHWESRIHPDDAHRLPEMDPETSDSVAVEYRWTGADEEVRYFLDQCVKIADDSTQRRWAGTLLDVSRQKRLEAQLVQAGKMDAIGQLTGGVAHDFNNLLSAIIGGLYLLERRIELSERDKLVVDQMRHAAEHGAELVRRMMAFARKQDLSPASLDPSVLCNSVAGLVEHTLGGTTKIDWHCPETSRNLYVDQPQLELALVNLILNARDAMPDGGTIEVLIEDIAVDGEPDCIRIRVRDEGHGVPADLIDKITEPFFTTKESGKGTGLGLSMVVGFVQQSGGRMEIDSADKKGTTIDLYLPSTPSPAEAKSKNRTEATMQSVGIQSILLVDDDDTVRTVLCEQLREMGIAVDAVADGDSAIRMLSEKDRSYDLLLTDYAMPGKNGVETIAGARGQQPKLRALLMTGYADDAAIAQIKQSVQVIRKPIDIQELTRLLS